MPLHAPSAEQLAAYQQRPGSRPVVLFYQCRPAPGTDLGELVQALARLARARSGTLAWAGEAEQVLIGDLPRYALCCRLHFKSRDAALRHVQASAHQALMERLETVELSVLGEQPWRVRLAVAVMARLLPRLPYDRRVDPGPEPGLGSSIMPSHEALAEFLAHPQPTRPVVMVNWLRFRDQAEYDPPQAPTVSGMTAYYRYGKVAFDTLHRLGARAQFVSRYQQLLIGRDGQPATGLWNDFVMVEYPGRASFKHMTSLRRYRAALAHRSAGLAEGGQGLIATRTL